MVEVTQADREAAEALLAEIGFGMVDAKGVAETLAAHREAAIAELVRWLRDRDGFNDFYSELQGKWLSDRIEAREPWKTKPPVV